MRYITVLATLLASYSFAQEPVISRLETDKNVWDVEIEDLNQDGVQDILLLTCDEKSYPLEKSLDIFLATPEKTVPVKATGVLKLHESIGALFLAEVDGASPRELIAVHGLGATIYKWTNGAFVESGKSDFVSLYPSGAKEPLFLKKGATDLDGDGIDEWLIPVTGGFELRNADGLVERVSSDVVSEIRRGESTYIMHRLPAYMTFSLESQPHLGLAFLSDEFADFAYGNGWSEHWRYKVPLNLQDKWEANTKMDDVNGDNFPDLLISQTRGTVNLQALTQVYIADKPLSYPEVPTATFEYKGTIAISAFKDVDGDGMKDFITVRVPFGVKNFINFFVRGKLSVDAEVHLFDGKGFGDKPAFSSNLTMDAPDGREQVAYALGDFNGDGRLDLAYGASKEELSVYIGEPERFISRTPWKKLSLPSFGTARVYSLDDNAAEDLVMFHPGGNNAKKAEVIIF